MIEPLFDEARLGAFLQRYGWEIVRPLKQDLSPRRYYRVGKGRACAIVMEAVPDEAFAAFIRIAQWLRAQGLHAPEIYEADSEGGYLLLEDFGDVSFKAALERGCDAQALYGTACEVLEVLAQVGDLPDLPRYYDSHIHRNHDFVVRYYLRREEDEVLAAYRAAWAEIETGLSPCPETFLHCDFHAENLMWIEGAQGLRRCGVLDFQGAMRGPRLYDLANLLEDARVDVPSALRSEALSHLSADERQRYRVLATQFHCRVIGQFIKIANETGRRGYLAHLPRLEGYLREALGDPLLKPLKDFFDKLGVDFSAAKDLNGGVFGCK